MNSVGIVIAHPMPHVQAALANYELRDGVQYNLWTPGGVLRGYDFLATVDQPWCPGVGYSERVKGLVGYLEGRQRTIVVFGETPPSRLMVGDFEVPDNVRIVPILCSDAPESGFWVEFGHVVGRPPIRCFQFEEAGAILDIVLGFGNTRVRQRAAVQYALEQFTGVRLTATGCQSAFQLHCVDTYTPGDTIGSYLAPFEPLRAYRRLRRGDPLPASETLVAYNPQTGFVCRGADVRQMLGIRRSSDTFVGHLLAHGFAPVDDSYVVRSGDWIAYDRRPKAAVPLAMTNKVREASDKQKITHF